MMAVFMPMLKRLEINMEKTKKFEENMKELEQIINELETGETDLDESINKYTAAMKLVKECDEKLKAVEERVSKMVLENGEEEPFEVTDN